MAAVASVIGQSKYNPPWTIAGYSISESILDKSRMDLKKNGTIIEQEQTHLYRNKVLQRHIVNGTKLFIYRKMKA